MKEQVFHSPHTSLNFYEGPNNGLPILLIHGSTSQWKTFTALIHDLQDHFHVFAVDLRGHGKSGRTPGAYKIQDHLNDIYAFIKEHIKKPVFIFGHSLGGMIAIMLAAQHPDMVKKLIVGDAPITLDAIRRLINSQALVAQMVIEWLRASQADKIQQLFGDQFGHNLSLCDPEMLSAMFNEFDVTFEEYKIDKLLPLINCPTLIIRGDEEKGSLITDADMEYAAELLPSLQQIALLSVGHSLMEDKDAVLEIIEGFIEDAISSN